MTRRGFLKLLGLAPLIPIAAKLHSAAPAPSAPLLHIPGGTYTSSGAKSGFLEWRDPPASTDGFSEWKDSGCPDLEVWRGLSDLEKGQVKAAHYNEVRALMSGQLATFVGYSFVRTELRAFPKDNPAVYAWKRAKWAWWDLRDWLTGAAA